MTNTDNTTTPTVETVAYEITIQKVLAAENTTPASDGTSVITCDPALEFTTTVQIDKEYIAHHDLLRTVFNVAVKKLFDGNALYSVGLMSQQSFNEETLEATFLATVSVTYPLGVLVPGFTASNSHRIPGDFLFKVKPEIPAGLSAWLVRAPAAQTP